MNDMKAAPYLKDWQIQAGIKASGEPFVFFVPMRPQPLDFVGSDDEGVLLVDSNCREYSIKLPWRAGERRWVREAFMILPTYAQGAYWPPETRPIESIDYYYKADCPDDNGPWCSPVVMAKGQARYALHFTEDAVPMRIQDVSLSEINNIGMALIDMGLRDRSWLPYDTYFDIWDASHKPGDRWADNAWVWKGVARMEGIEK